MTDGPKLVGIVTDRDHLVGIITETNLLRAFVKSG